MNKYITWLAILWILKVVFAHTKPLGKDDRVTVALLAPLLWCGVAFIFNTWVADMIGFPQITTFKQFFWLVLIL